MTNEADSEVKNEEISEVKVKNRHPASREITLSFRISRVTKEAIMAAVRGYELDNPDTRYSISAFCIDAIKEKLSRMARMKL